MKALHIRICKPPPPSSSHSKEKIVAKLCVIFLESMQKQFSYFFNLTKFSFDSSKEMCVFFFNLCQLDKMKMTF